MFSFVCTNLVGPVVLLTVTPIGSTRGGLPVAFYVMQACQATQPSMYAMLSRNVARQTKKSIVFAIFCESPFSHLPLADMSWSSLGQLGMLSARSCSKPFGLYFNSFYIYLGLYVVFTVDVLVMRILIVRRNAQRDQDFQGENIHAQAFADMTDLQNKEFRYAY